jgi:purine-binding chemotaxis protein CheW
MLVCRARGRLCALRAAEIVETMRPLPVEPWVGMPPFVLGVSLIRGVPTPVVDVGALLGDGAQQAFTRFVTLRVGDRRVALAVEEVIGMRGLDVALSIETPPLLRAASGQVVATLGALDAALVSVLSAARLLPETDPGASADGSVGGAAGGGGGRPAHGSGGGA